eukprot:3489161-Pyramimonas_sp.AAC.2
MAGTAAPVGHDHGEPGGSARAQRHGRRRDPVCAVHRRAGQRGQVTNHAIGPCGRNIPPPFA